MRTIITYFNLFLFVDFWIASSCYPLFWHDCAGAGRADYRPKSNIFALGILDWLFDFAYFATKPNNRQLLPFLCGGHRAGGGL